VIPDELAGRRIAVTGATGFLGTALVERLLRSVPECEVVVVVRPGQHQGPAERTRREILRNAWVPLARAQQMLKPWQASLLAKVSPSAT